MQGDGSVKATPRKTLFQKAQEELEMQRSGVTGNFMPSNPAGMRQTRTGTNTAPTKPEVRPSVGGPIRGAGGMMSGRNPATTPSASESGYIQGDRGALVKNPDYKPSKPVTREKYVDTVPEGYENPYVMKPGTQITGTAGASAMMSGGDPTKPVVSTYVPKPVDISPGKTESKPQAAAEKSTPVSEATIETDRPSSPTDINTDSSTIVNANGVRQSGRNLGYRSTITKGEGDTPYLEGKGGLFDRLGLGTSTQINRNWSSNQLPGTETALYGGKPVSEQLGEGEQNLVLSKDLDQDGGAVRNLESMPQEAFVESQKSGDSSGGQRNWMEKGPEDAKMARRRAFLDAPNSMAGMRAVDAQLGRVRSGNDFFYANPNQGQEGADEFIKVSLADGRKHQNDQISGQQLLNQYVDKIKGENVGNPDAPSPMEFSPDMSEEQFVDFQNRGGSQRSIEDTEIEDFINYQN